jgi:hypothetical protein
MRHMRPQKKWMRKPVKAFSDTVARSLAIQIEIPETLGLALQHRHRGVVPTEPRHRAAAAGT